MKKIFTSTTFLICLFFTMTASAETLYGGHVSDVIQLMKSVGNEIGFSVWGTEYYTYQGVKRCELHFGHSQNNLIRFRLNSDNSVARMLVSVPSSYNSSEAFEDAVNAGALAGVCCVASGVNESEFKQLWSTLWSDAVDNMFATHFHKRYSVWCSRAQQYIIADVEMDDSKVDFYFYPD